jgi:ferredoxin--NADP+ reductase
MFEITSARFLAPDIRHIVVRAPRIARRQQPGQFVIVRVYERGERIPLTIAEADPREGTITLVVQGVGVTTKRLNALAAGESILDVVGPLGHPSDVRLYGRVVVIGGGVGTAIALPTARALKRASNHVIAILGARTRELVILEAEMREASHELFVTTDDGSYGEHGLVTDRLVRLLDPQPPDLVLAIGPVPMMRAVAEATLGRGVKTVVSLNSIMVDGTGMCGGCRVSVGGESRFACVDGPEFDAHQVDFAVLSQRNAMYREAERCSLERYEAGR